MSCTQCNNCLLVSVFGSTGFMNALQDIGVCPSPPVKRVAVRSLQAPGAAQLAGHSAGPPRPQPDSRHAAPPFRGSAAVGSCPHWALSHGAARTERGLCTGVERRAAQGQEEATHCPQGVRGVIHNVIIVCSLACVQMLCVQMSLWEHNLVLTKHVRVVDPATRCYSCMLPPRWDGSATAGH